MGLGESELMGALVDLRTVKDGFAQAPPGIRPISTRFGLPDVVYDSLTYYQTRWIRAIAVGKSVRCAALAGRSAARALDMWVVGPEKEPVELTPASGSVPSKTQWPPDCVYLRPRRRPAEIIEHDGFHTTDPLSAALEIALRHGFREGLVSMDWVLRNHATRDEVTDAVQDLGRVRCLDHVFSNGVVGIG